MIGKWNKSVILTYIGLALGVLGISLILLDVEIKYSLICLMFAGICDLFDGTVARRCKRTKDEKAFGIELDSLVDVLNFIAFPLVLIISVNKNIYFLPIYIMYAIFAVARLAHFNITSPKNNKPVPHYEGLPVTYAALIFPVVFILYYLIKENIFIPLINIIMGIVGILFILKVKVPKPKLVSSIILLLISLVMTVVYILI